MQRLSLLINVLVALEHLVVTVLLKTFLASDMWSLIARKYMQRHLNMLQEYVRVLYSSVVHIT